MTKRTYGVSWQEEGEEVFAGKLELGLTRLRLEGRARNGAEVLRVLPYHDLGGVATERRNGHREVSFTRFGRRFYITVIDGAGAFAELRNELERLVETPDAESGAPPTRDGQ